ncbi:hypothetical protein Ae168Ps1_5114 [Pseudonocardia sp. Ae168_Ps1]|nr:hypothetical protein Ae168Ps1_5114 [Pseudonocardia sp. Ae168_Ps1]OLL83179.1 hypothetical protein Ae263Ps1_0234c [Pseudonocardia sp. Ae263_Ps1]OLL90783.1 hypothetical protein Ae356Ps1_0680 [Pseudonocardia sp. Ae356_Ps1]
MCDPCDATRFGRVTCLVARLHVDFMRITSATCRPRR